MLSKLVKKYGLGKSVDAYINFAALELNVTESTVNKAHERYAKLKPYSFDETSSLLACAMIYEAAILTGEYVHYKKWSRVCSYNTLLIHVKRQRSTWRQAANISS